MAIQPNARVPRIDRYAGVVSKFRTPMRQLCDLFLHWGGRCNGRPPSVLEITKMLRHFHRCRGDLAHPIPRPSRSAPLKHISGGPYLRNVHTQVFLLRRPSFGGLLTWAKIAQSSTDRISSTLHKQGLSRFNWSCWVLVLGREVAPHHHRLAHAARSRFRLRWRLTSPPVRP